MLTPNEIFSLKGRTALVTGSSRGIGAAIAKGLAGAGARVVVHGHRKQACENTLSTLISAGCEAYAIGQDLSTPGAGRAVIEKAEAVAGPLDVVVINASAQINDGLAELKPQDLEFQLNVNIRSTIELLQSCLPLMAERKWGRVVSIGSINQLRPKQIVTAYAATKAAQHNIMQSLARDYAKHNVLLNTLAPGLIDTDRSADRKTEDPEGFAAYVRELNWMGREGTVDEMVGGALLLASDACGFMTGETIFMTGGY